MTLKWNIKSCEFKIQGEFRISRGARTSAKSLEVVLEKDGVAGRGECVPYARFGETLGSSAEQINSFLEQFSAQLNRETLQRLMPAGAARNAIDSAMWDLEAKLSGTPVWQLRESLGSELIAKPLLSAYTISADTPENMHKKALALGRFPLLKLKLTGTNDLACIKAVHLAQPQAQIILDANEAWSLELYEKIGPELSSLGVIMIEQPLPADSKEVLEPLEGIHLCADESVTDLNSLTQLPGHFSMINIKLDKAGGLTEALSMIRYARQHNMEVMVGCMLGSSLAMAPAYVAALHADIVDLDGPLLLAEDRESPFKFNDAYMQPPSPELWG